MRNRRAFISILVSGTGDVTAPTVAITSTETGPTSANPVPITITFSEAVTGFEVGDITPGGVFGSVSNFAGSGAMYTADANITIGGAGTGTIDIAANVAQDAAGNNNTAATQFTIQSSLAFIDTFTGVDGTNLSAHTPDLCPVGAAWSKISPLAETTISGNRAVTAVTSTIYAIETGVSNFTFTGVVNMTNAGFFGVIVRYTDASNYWYLLWRKSDNTLQIHKRESASGALMASVPKTLNLGQDYTFTAVCNDASISFTIDGTTVNYSSEFNKTATKIGLWASVAGSWDTFAV